MSRRSVYLAGPMSGIEAFNFPAFHVEAKRLRAAGFDVVNPAELVTDTDTPWAECMRADIAVLVRDCYAIALLPGWQRSRGASLEVQIARALGMRIGLASEFVRDASLYSEAA